MSRITLPSGVCTQRGRSVFGSMRPSRRGDY